jgi:hypothetical protein
MVIALNSHVENELKILTQINAFYHYKTLGLVALIKNFPTEVRFVLSNSYKEYEEVKQELLAKLRASE